MGELLIFDVVHHASERGDARSGADQINVGINAFRQCENTLRPSKRKFGTLFHFIEQVSRPGTVFEFNDDQFKHIGAVRPARNGVTAPSFVGFFVYRQVEGHELPRFEIKSFQFGDLYPETPGLIGFVADPYDFAGSPGR